ncbi:MAG: YceI family protein [Pseudomonadota bacterium]
MPIASTPSLAVVRVVVTLALLLCAGAPSSAELRRYALDPAGSEIGFTYQILGDSFNGEIPVSEADILIDFRDVTRTEARVALDARRARAGVVLATQALRGASVLDINRYPTISFASTRTRSDGAGAVMDGNLTVRGVTRPVQLRARFLRPPDSDPDVLDELAILLTGSISRAEFGATGYANLVADQIDLRIRAAIRALN